MGVNNAELYMNIGLCCFYCQQLDLAIACIDQAHAIATDDVQADLWYNTAHIALANGDIKMADRCLRLALAANPEHAESMCNLGILKMREGKVTQARNWFHSASNKGPHLFEAHFNLALLCYQMGLYEEAYTYAKKSIEVFPEHVYSKNLCEHIEKLLIQA
uniref:Tetratricopeptide repeat protein n=1 Tax=Acrobeloides nanus TaxID=290746 RepID=A0A914DA24_9BILA